MGDVEREHSWRWDVVATCAAIAISCLVIALEIAKADDPPLPLQAYPLAVLSGLSLLARRRYPIPVVVFTGAMTVVMLSTGSQGSTAALLIALYSLAKYERRWVAILSGGIVIFTGTLAAGMSHSWEMASRSLPWLIIVLEAGIIAGEIAGRQQRALEAAHARAAEAERSKEELARSRAAEERVRIARELHDSLTHAISVVNVQSSVALHMLSRQPELARASLSNIREASQDAMRELRATLRALRVADADSETAPGIDSLDLLINRAPLHVVLDITPDRPVLSGAIDRTVYRIAQEALTNSTRHADATTASINIAIGEQNVTTTIRDDGCGPEPAGIAEGLGLIGMRERVTALGGQLHCGPAPRGGFEVRAVLPLSETTTKEPAL